MLTFGFGVKMTGRVAALRERVDAEIAKGRSDCAFWSRLAAAREREATSSAERPGQDGSALGGDGAVANGRKRSHEETGKSLSPDHSPQRRKITTTSPSSEEPPLASKAGGEEAESRDASRDQ